MTARPKIAAAVITLNEAANLPGLLRDLAWVDQIVVVDGGSQDETVRIAESAGCRVVSRRFDDFASQRNAALALTECEWILSIDADERLPEATVDEMLGCITSARISACRVPIRSCLFGQPVRRCGTQDDRPIRLFRRQCGRWEGPVHETLRVSGRVKTLRSWIEHHTIPDLHTFLAKMHCYTTLEAATRTAAGRRPRRSDEWLSPAAEFFRRFAWKGGALDGPVGWAFCALSGLSEWVLARRHRQMWQSRRRPCERTMHLRETAAQGAQTTWDKQPSTGAGVGQPTTTWSTPGDHTRPELHEAMGRRTEAA